MVGTHNNQIGTDLACQSRDPHASFARRDLAFNVVCIANHGFQLFHHARCQVVFRFHSHKFNRKSGDFFQHRHQRDFAPRRKNLARKGQLLRGKGFVVDGHGN